MAFFSLAIIVLAAGSVCRAETVQGSGGGFPSANFSIGAESPASGRLLGRIMYNPPVQGKWLEQVADGYFVFHEGDVTVKDSEMTRRSGTRSRWPVANAELYGAGIPDMTVSFSAFAPVVREDSFSTSLPAVLAEFSFKNEADAAREISLTWVCGDACAGMSPSMHSKLWRRAMGGLSIAADAPAEKEGGAPENKITWKITVPTRTKGRLRIAFMRYHDNGYAASRLTSETALAKYVIEHWDTLYKSTLEFDAAMLPDRYGGTLEDAAHWYMTAAMMLTKVMRDGTALTMGYSELNQRDSYWTSFVHLVYWPELEKKMIEESAAAQKPNGKIPTTILPEIERGTDIDINCYFVMRIFRRAAFVGDTELLKRNWPAVKAALGFIESLDEDGDGLPDQKSYWADWKDVPGVEGRKYGPHFVLLWIAALRHASEWAAVAGDPAAATEYKAKYEKALASANRPVESGGLWNGAYYVNVWRDGREEKHVLEDQIVGILFGVVDKQKADSIYEALKPNETENGIRETYPYYPESSFGLRAGDYHNGAIWPWLNFADALSRFRSGRADEAVRLLEKVAKSDLIAGNDYLPHENIDGETGENTHFWLQGWDAAYFAAIYFGILHPEAKFY